MCTSRTDENTEQAKSAEVAAPQSSKEDGKDVSESIAPFFPYDGIQLKPNRYM
jgi:hypothetical protein